MAVSTLGFRTLVLMLAENTALVASWPGRCPRACVLTSSVCAQLELPVTQWRAWTAMALRPSCWPRSGPTRYVTAFASYILASFLRPDPEYPPPSWLRHIENDSAFVAWCRCLSELRHCLCLVFPLPFGARHRLCLAVLRLLLMRRASRQRHWCVLSPLVSKSLFCLVCFSCLFCLLCLLYLVNLVCFFVGFCFLACLFLFGLFGKQRRTTTGKG